jgi:hypothetical protein
MWHKWHKVFVHIIFAPNVTLEALAQFWKKPTFVLEGPTLENAQIDILPILP